MSAPAQHAEYLADAVQVLLVDGIPPMLEAVNARHAARGKPLPLAVPVFDEVGSDTETYLNTTGEQRPSIQDVSRITIYAAPRKEGDDRSDQGTHADGEHALFIETLVGGATEQQSLRRKWRVDEVVLGALRAERHVLVDFGDGTHTMYKLVSSVPAVGDGPPVADRTGVGNDGYIRRGEIIARYRGTYER